MFERLILFIAAFGLSDLFIKNKSTNFKIIYYIVLLLIALYFIFNKYIHEKLLKKFSKKKIRV